MKLTRIHPIERIALHIAAIICIVLSRLHFATVFLFARFIHPNLTSMNSYFIMAGPFLSIIWACFKDTTVCSQITTRTGPAIKAECTRKQKNIFSFHHFLKKCFLNSIIKHSNIWEITLKLKCYGLVLVLLIIIMIRIIFVDK